MATPRPPIYSICTRQFFMKFQNLGDIHQICISGKIFAFHRDTKYILEHLFD